MSRRVAQQHQPRHPALKRQLTYPDYLAPHVGNNVMQRMQGWIGRKDRFAVAIEAVVHRADGSTASVRLTDFSEEGCRIEGDDHFQIGEQIRIDVPRLGPMEAQIRWALPGSAGTRFLKADD